MKCESCQREIKQSVEEKFPPCPNCRQSQNFTLIRTVGWHCKKCDAGPYKMHTTGWVKK